MNQTAELRTLTSYLQEACQCVLYGVCARGTYRANIHSDMHPNFTDFGGSMGRFLMRYRSTATTYARWFCPPSSRNTSPPALTVCTFHLSVTQLTCTRSQLQASCPATLPNRRVGHFTSEITSMTSNAP